MMRKWMCFAVLVLECATGACAQAPDDSPVAAAESMLAQLESQGKDVKAARAELDGLRPEWAEIKKQRDELEGRIKTFAPRMEALMQKVQQAGGGGGTPIEGASRALAQLGAQGKDVAPLRTELDLLKPEWEAIAKAQAALGQLPADQREAAEKALHAMVDTFRPKMEALGKKIQALAQGGGGHDGGK